MAAIEREIMERISKLDADSKYRVLNFVRSLSAPAGIAGEDLIARAHQVDFAPADLDEIELAIERGCERIDPGADNIEFPA